MKLLIAVATVLVSCTPGAADDCVILSTAMAAKGPQGYAFAAALGASAFSTVDECNASLLAGWNSTLDYFSQSGMAGADSYTMSCVIPASCNPSDENTSKPETRTIFPFVVENLR